METTIGSERSYKDRIKLPFQFDVSKMQEEVSSLGLNSFIYYNVIPLRAPAHLVDFSRQPPPQTDDYADGSWTEWLDSKSFLNCVYLQEIVNTFKAKTKVTLVRLLRLESGALVKEHTDPTLGLHIDKSVIRLTIPIFSDDSVDFYLNQTLVPMKPGECWYMDLTKTHSINNRSDKERVNMTIDVIPNEWIIAQLLSADDG